MLKNLLSIKSSFRSLRSFPPLFSFAILAEPFNSNEYEGKSLQYLQELKTLPYSDLLVEMKKFPGKPDSRTKFNIIRFIASNMPKKVVSKPPSETYKLTIDINTSSKDDTISTIYANAYDIENDPDFNISLTDQSLYENEVMSGPLHTYSSVFFSNSKGLNNKLPYIENYSSHQILAETNKAKESTLRNEIMSLISRSDLFRNTALESTVMNYKSREIKRVFYEMANIEGEYQMLTVDELLKLMTQMKDNQIYSYTVNKVIKTLSDPFLCLNYISFFKGAPSNILNITWQTISSLIDRKFIQFI